VDHREATVTQPGGVFWTAKIIESFNCEVEAVMGVGGMVPPHTGMDVTPTMTVTGAAHSTAALPMSLTATMAMAAGEHDVVALPQSLTATMGMSGVGVSHPSYDNSAASSYQNAVASPATFTWSHTTAAGSYAIVLVACGEGFSNMGGPAGTTTATVTFGGVTLSSLGAVKANNDGNRGWLWVFGGNVSSAGSGSKTVSVTLTESGLSFYGWGSSYTYQAVGSVGTLQTAFGASTSPTKAVTSASGRRVWGSVMANAFGDNLTSFSLTARQTKQVTGNPGFTAGDAAGAATVTVSASMTSDEWAVVGLDLLP
jgi:hypothetical protein